MMRLMVTVESGSPVRVLAALGGPLVEALTQKIRALNSPCNNTHCAALPGDRGDAAAGEQGGKALANNNRQSRSGKSPSAGRLVMRVGKL
jgi:hypothetical protein